MADDWAPPEFAVVRRGYSPEQVDATFSDLVRDLTTLRVERDGLRKACTGLEAEVGRLTSDGPTYRGLGDRVEQILALAEEEAAELRRTTAAEAETVREAAQRDAETVRAEAERFAQDRRDEANDFLQHNRAEAEQAAADFKITLAQRREEAQRDFDTRMAAADALQVDAERRAASLREDCEAMLADAEKRGEQIVAAARAKAAETDREAAARTERSRAESERELAVLVARRDAINKQLTNVRESLANLTGSVAADPSTDPPAEPRTDPPTDPPTGGAATEVGGAEPAKGAPGPKQPAGAGSESETPPKPTERPEATAPPTSPTTKPEPPAPKKATTPRPADETQVLPKASPAGPSRP